MRQRRRGFTLMEALIALAVLSIGMLGAAAMLVGSMRTHADALRRIVALNLLRDMADRIRANAHARGAYDTRVPGTACTGTDACGPAERAAADLGHFVSAAREVSPVGKAVVRFEPATGPAAPERFVIALDVARDPSEPDVLSLTVLAQPPVAGGA
jgi:type IV pilus assembly protein PilV